MENIQPLLAPVSGHVDICVGVDEGAETLLVFWGLVLMERVPKSDRLGWKLLAARLYNLGFPRRMLAEAMEVSHTTLRRWGLALQSGDPDRLRKALSGQGAEKKVTAPIEAFVRFRFRELRGRVRAFARQIMAEVKAIFRVSVSVSRLHPIFADERRKLNRASAPARPGVEEPKVREAGPPMTSAPVTDAARGDGEAACREEPPGTAATAMPVSAVVVADGTIGGLDAVVPSLLLPVTRQLSFHPDFLAPGLGEEPRHYFCHLAGLFLLLPEVERWLGDWPALERRELIRQFCLQILAGAVNHEHSKAVESTSLELLTGPVIRSVDHQRVLSDHLATAANLRALARLNLAYTGAAASPCLYFDPHAKEYTGVQRQLKGWCGATHDIRKVLYLDAIHTAEGAPCYLSPADNYEDTRERFFAVREAFVRQLDGPAGPLVWVFDRALYALPALRHILDLGDGFITWEKGYAGDGWDAAAPAASFTRGRPRNQADDRRYYRFEYQVAPWTREPRMSRYIVRASGPDRPAIEVAILAANAPLPHDQTIWTMFNRWLQENDFRYLIRHMGLNELTSRAVDTYDELRPTLTDRQVESRAHKQAVRERDHLEGHYGRLLVKRERSGRRLSTTLHQLQQERQQLQQDYQQLIAQMTACRQQLDRLPAEPPTTTTDELFDQANQLKRRHDRHDARYQRYQERSDLEAKLQADRRELTDVEKRLADIPATESHLQALVDDGYVRLRTARKTFMDNIRLAARNIFYRTIAPFRHAYDNYRDDHTLFRALTRTPGLIRYHGHHLDILLLPTIDVGPKLRDTLAPILADHADQLQALYARSGHHLQVSIQLYDPATHRL